ncbi:MAG TPA: terminase small subunit [Steroidobacteraceae bacterium]|jgi:phage terminase small subunit|nr:terminase small subunit [Steroidobacteraceae bacterium]
MDDLPPTDQFVVADSPPAIVPTRALTPRQAAFAQAFAAHGSAARAYREAFGCGAMSAATIRRKAYDYAHHPAIAERVRELLAQAAEGVTLSARARMVRLQSIVEADPSELLRIVAECCRWCHGAGHAYQWIDPAEYAQALRIAHAANQARRRAGRTEQPLPMDDGGYGFRADAEPHPGCPHCRGEGTKRVVVTPTDDLSAGARALLKSIRQKASGEIEVRLHDPLEAIDLLNRMQGVYVERSVSVTAHVNAPKFEAMTPEEQASFIRSLGVPQSAGPLPAVVHDAPPDDAPALPPAIVERPAATPAPAPPVEPEHGDALEADPYAISRRPTSALTMEQMLARSRRW